MDYAFQECRITNAHCGTEDDTVWENTDKDNSGSKCDVECQI